MPLELDHLRDSLAALMDSLALTEEEAHAAETGRRRHATLQAGAIKQFEITYELCWKLMKRWLSANVSPDITDGIAKQQLFRFAAENRLIDDSVVWMDYHKARNKTAHIYDGTIAEQVYRASMEFVHDARRLLVALEARNG